MIIQIIKLKSAVSEEILIDKAHERAPQFRAIPGLIQKYYFKMKEPGYYGGLYIWDSVESLQEFRQSDLASSVAAAYQVTEPPNVELLDVLFTLRE